MEADVAEESVAGAKFRVKLTPLVDVMVTGARVVGRLRVVVMHGSVRVTKIVASAAVTPVNDASLTFKVKS